MFADAVHHVAARTIGGGKGQGFLGVGQVRAGQVSRAALGLGDDGVDDIERHLARLAGRNLWLVFAELALVGVHGLKEAIGQIAIEAALKLGLVGGGDETGMPFAAHVLRAGAGSAPGGEDFGGDFERRIGDAQCCLGAGQFLSAERGAVDLFGAGLLGRAKADGGLGGDQGRAVGLAGLEQGLFDGGLIVAVDADGVPARRLKAGDLVGRVGIGDRAVDGDRVVVPDDGELVELEVTSERDGFLGDAFHQATVAGEAPGMVIHQVIAEFGCQLGFGNGHADGVADALAERAGGGFDALRIAIFRVAGGLGMELAEILDLLDGHVFVTEQVERRVKQHRAVAGREHEAVAVSPFAVSGIELHDLGEEYRGDIGAAHGQARMAGVGFFDRVHRERADRIGQIVLLGCIGHQKGAFFGTEIWGEDEPEASSQRRFEA